MGNKKFETKGLLIQNLFIYTVAVIMGGWIILDILMQTQVEFDQFIDYYSQGTGATRSTSAIVSVVYKYFGKTGCLFMMAVLTICIIYCWGKQIMKLCRFLRKERLFKQGLVADMDDDHVSRSLFVILKELFSCKSFFRKPKIYSRKELRRMQQKLEESENNATKSRRNRKL